MKFEVGDRVVARSDLPDDDIYDDWHTHFDVGTVCALPSNYTEGTHVAVRWDGVDYHLDRSPDNCHTTPVHVLEHVVSDEEVQAAIESILRGSN